MEAAAGCLPCWRSPSHASNLLPRRLPATLPCRSLCSSSRCMLTCRPAAVVQPPHILPNTPDLPNTRGSTCPVASSLAVVHVWGLALHGSEPCMRAAGCRPEGGQAEAWVVWMLKEGEGQGEVNAGGQSGEESGRDQSERGVAWVASTRGARAPRAAGAQAGGMPQMPSPLPLVGRHTSPMVQQGTTRGSEPGTRHSVPRGLLQFARVAAGGECDESQSGGEASAHAWQRTDHQEGGAGRRRARTHSRAPIGLAHRLTSRRRQGGCRAGCRRARGTRPGPRSRGR